MIDASIPLQIQTPPAPNLIQNVGQLMQIRDAASQIALRQAQTQQAQQQQQLIQTEVAQNNRDMTDQNSAQDWLKDPKNAYAFGKGDLSGLLGKVQTKSYQALQKTAMDAQEQHLTLGEKTLALNGQKLAGIQTGLDGLTTLPDDAARSAAWPELKQQWQKLGYLDEIPPDAIPAAISGKPEEIQAMAAKLNVAKGLTDAALSRAKAQADVPKVISETTEAIGKGKQAEAAANLDVLKQQILQHELDLYNTLKTPGALEQRVAGSIDQQKYPNEYRMAVNEARNEPDLKGINAVIGKHAQNISEREKTIAVESSPEVMAARRNQAISIEQATNPLKLEQARAQAGATAGAREALRLDQDYVKSAAATEALGKVLDLTASANKAAGSALPTLSAITVNHLNDLRRLNRQEVVGLGGEQAGNLWDHLEGFLQKATVGVTKIPEGIQSDMRELHQSLADNAYKQYTTGLSSLSKRSGTQYAPTVNAPNIRQANPSDGQGGYQVGHIYGGMEYLGGDINKAENWKKR